MNAAALRQNTEIQSSKIINNNYKTWLFINSKAYKTKIKYECNVDNKIFFYCNVR